MTSNCDVTIVTLSCGSGCMYAYGYNKQRERESGSLCMSGLEMGYTYGLKGAINFHLIIIKYNTIAMNWTRRYMVCILHIVLQKYSPIRYTLYVYITLYIRPFFVPYIPAIPDFSRQQWGGIERAVGRRTAHYQATFITVLCSVRIFSSIRLDFFHYIETEQHFCQKQPEM